MKAEARMKLRPTVLLLSFVFCGVLLGAQNAAAEAEQSASAEVVLEGDYEIGSQEDFDGLIAAGGGGPFRISGNLIIKHTPITTLEGLENLTSVENFLIIEFNESLTTLAPLSNIKRSGGTECSVE